MNGGVVVAGREELQRASGMEAGTNLGEHGFRDAAETGGGNSVVESRPSKPMVAGSNPVPRSIRFRLRISAAKNITS
jgi:hypothetical protein